MTETPAARSRIVVGVDGSPGSRDALRWAARQARLTGAELDAVIPWEYPAFFGWAPVSPDDVDFAKVAEEALAAAVTEVLGREWPAWVHTQVIEGYPAEVLGSVSTYCMHHATVPVTVIRPEARHDHRHPH